MFANRRTLFTFVATALLSAAGHISAQILPVNSSRYRVITAPEFATGYPATARAFSWVDSERLLFLSNDRQLSETEKRGDRTVVTKAVPTIHLWDIRAGTIRRYRDEPLWAYLCAVDGRTLYGLRRGEKNIVFEGMFGSEVERESTSFRNLGGSPVAPHINPFSCKEYWYSDLPRPNGGRAFPLKAEHGVYERVASDKTWWMPPFKWWIHSAGTSREVPFPDPNEDVYSPLAYSSFAAGYIFWRQENRLSRGIPNRFYLWLPAANAVRVLDILGSQNWTALYHPGITRAGLVAKSSTPVANRRVKWDPGPAGLYLFSGSVVDEFIGQVGTASSSSTKAPFGVEQIVSGLIDEISEVSPDGCKIALVVDPWDGEERVSRLEVIDFCSKRGTNHVAK